MLTNVHEEKIENSVIIVLVISFTKEDWDQNNLYLLN